MSKFWSPFVKDLVPYVPGEQPKVANLVKLNTNENPYGPSPKAIEAMRAELSDALRLYPDPNSDLLKQAVADYINSLGIGESVLLSRVYSPANLGVVSGGNARYYDINELLIGTSSGGVAAANVIIAYDGAASCTPANIQITAAA